MVAPFAPKVTPRFEFNVKLAFANNPPPLITKLFVVADNGVAPKLASVEIDKTPANIVVEPVYVLVADRVAVPAPSLLKFAMGVAIGSATAIFPAPPRVKLYEADPVMALPLATSKVNVPLSELILELEAKVIRPA